MQLHLEWSVVEMLVPRDGSGRCKFTLVVFYISVVNYKVKVKYSYPVTGRGGL
jgi:hypothetical protein